MATELERLAAAGTESSLARYSAPDDAGGEPSYEDMCKAHIEAFINAAAAAEVQTELASRCARVRSRAFERKRVQNAMSMPHLPALAMHNCLAEQKHCHYVGLHAFDWTRQLGIIARLSRRRVAGWRAKILPIVEEQDARDPFDIHVYGDCILTRLTQLRVTGADAPLAICGAAGPPAVGGKSTAERHSAVEQLPAPPVELSRALADEEQWRISRRALKHGSTCSGVAHTGNLLRMPQLQPTGMHR